MEHESWRSNSWSFIIIDNCIHCLSFVVFSSGPARIGKRGNFSYDEWLGRKKSAEQKIISVRKAEEEKKRLEEDERYVMFVLFSYCFCFV